MPVQATAETELHVSEFFSSIQGEGLHIGARQVFLRLCDCNLDCRFCDTDFQRKDLFRLEDDPGSGRFSLSPNPVSVNTICQKLDEWLTMTPKLHQAISLTGGEPLMQSQALLNGLPELKKRLPLHLETNGILFQSLVDLLPFLDFLSIDIKLPSVTGEGQTWNEHRQFLELAKDTPAQIKVVADENLCTDELLEAAVLANEHLPNAPLFLQPVTRDGRPSVDGAQLLLWQQQISTYHPDCRVVPQIHPLLGIA